MKINILIIGGDSFIASKFIEVNNDLYNLKIISRKVTGNNNEIVLDNFFEIDNTIYNNVDVIINFAAIVHQNHVVVNSLYEEVNTKLPIHLASLAKKGGVKHFIQMSTISVYGESTYINENSIEKPDTLYGQSKFNADKYILGLQDDNFKVSIIRPPMVYGGGNAPGNMMKLIKVAQRGIPMPFKGIKNSRDFININNLVQVLNITIENCISNIIIPTDKKPVSTEEIINYVRKYSNSKIRIIKVPSFVLKSLKIIKPKLYIKVFGSLRVVCNINSKIYNPIYTLEDGIKEMVNI